MLKLLQEDQEQSEVQKKAAPEDHIVSKTNVFCHEACKEGSQQLSQEESPEAGEEGNHQEDKKLQEAQTKNQDKKETSPVTSISREEIMVGKTNKYCQECYEEASQEERQDSRQVEESPEIQEEEMLREER